MCLIWVLKELFYLRDKLFVLYAECEKHATFYYLQRPHFGSLQMFLLLALQVRNPRNRKGCQTMRSWPARRIDSDPSWSNSRSPGTLRRDSILRSSWHYFAGYRRGFRFLLVIVETERYVMLKYEKYPFSVFCDIGTVSVSLSATCLTWTNLWIR